MGLLFSRRRKDGSFQPSWLHQRLKPATSGNRINGLDEKTPRRASPIYHHPLPQQPWYRVQRLFYLRMMFNPWYVKPGIEIQRLMAEPHQPLAAATVERPAGEWLAACREYALANGADLFGVTAMKPEYVFEGYPVPPEKWLILLGVTMDHGKLQRIVRKGVDSVGGAHVIDVYNHGTRTARRLANWIRRQGWHAKGACGPAAGPINLLPAALQAGLGELGKHGSLISRQFGSNFRIGYVLTDLPLQATEPDEFGADDFCVRCQVCRKNCPPDAINDSKQWVRGAEKWYVDFDKCVPYFNDTQGCGICITVCPWSTPGRAETLVAKLARRRAREQSPTPGGAS